MLVAGIAYALNMGDISGGGTSSGGSVMGSYVANPATIVNIVQGNGNYTVIESTQVNSYSSNTSGANTLWKHLFKGYRTTQDATYAEDEVTIGNNTFFNYNASRTITAHGSGGDAVISLAGGITTTPGWVYVQQRLYVYGRIASGGEEITTEAGILSPKSQTKAQLLAAAPTAAGLLYYCSDCSTDGIVVSTGTGTGAFGRISARTTVIN